jgi:hypothetical protein
VHDVGARQPRTDLAAPVVADNVGLDTVVSVLAVSVFVHLADYVGIGTSLGCVRLAAELRHWDGHQGDHGCRAVIGEHHRDTARLAEDQRRVGAVR